MKNINIDGLSELSTAAKVFLKQFNEPKVIAFIGEMGAGKTTFIKALCAELKVIDIVNSPTFAIVNDYETEHNTHVYHFDLYRMDRPEEVEDIGFEDYIYSGNWCFIEWPEIAEKYFPDDIIKVKIEELENRTRQIQFIDN